ncbi:MAG: hypothetical protein J0G32_00090 [Alphaproteobacteria bacterium]|nr:hypothetical protein [Alphaproteobacteria bacterium]OJV16287.1 MAG: hypothetical protein BGO27_02930 [Alphaproteobacteria bacterium 33-17]
MLSKDQIKKLSDGIKQNQKHFQSMLPAKYSIISCHMIMTSFLSWAGHKTNISNTAYAAADEIALHKVFNYPNTNSMFSDHNPFHKTIKNTVALFEEVGVNDPNIFAPIVEKLYRECIDNQIKNEHPSSSRITEALEQLAQQKALTSLHHKPIESMLQEGLKKDSKPKNIQSNSKGL